MIAQISPWLRDAGLAATALIAITAFITLFGRSKPVRYTFRKLVGDPVSAWLKSTIKGEMTDVCVRLKAVEVELKPNGGKSLRDRVDWIATKLDQ